MSIKELHSRLDLLFADLEKEVTTLDQVDQPLVQGWTWECDHNGLFVMCSHEVEKVLGIAPSEFIGKRLANFQLADASIAILETALKNPSSPLTIELDYQAVDNQLVRVTLNILSFPKKNGSKESKLRGFTQVVDTNQKEEWARQGSLTPQEKVEARDRKIELSRPSQSQFVRETTKASNDGSDSLLVPVEVEKESFGLIEILDQRPQKRWSGDEKRLVEQVADQLSLALENAHLFKQTQLALADTQARAKELALLNEMSRAFSSKLDVSAVIERIYTYTSRLMDTYNFYVALYEQDSDQISFPLVIADGERVTEGHPEWESWSAIQPASGLTGHVIRSREPLLIKADVLTQLDEQHIDYVEVGSGGVSAWLGVPMMIGDRVIGVVTVQSEDIPWLYDEHHRDLLSSIGNQAAIAIENARLLDETRRRNEELSALNTITSAASQSLDLDEILNEGLQQVLATTSLGAGLIGIASKGDGELVLKAHHGLPATIVEHLEKTGLKGTLCDQTFRRGTVVKLDDLSKVDFRGTGNLLGLGFKSYLGIPLESKGKVLGTLCAFGISEDSKPEINLMMMRSIGQQVGVAIENAQLFEEQRQTAQRLRELDRLKSQFLANMSHELRTPLNSIIGFSRVILKGIDGPITDLQQQDLTAIYNSGQHLLGMINDILDLSKIEAGKIEINFEEVNLNDLIKSVMATAVGLVKDKPIDLFQVIPDDLPVVQADPLRIRQVILNLLSNAAKFTDEGSITIKIHQETANKGKEEIVISVIDTGPGIALDDQQKLFQPFSQVDASPTRKTGGSGLGLSICRALVEMHGGKIGLESEIDQGSNFYFTIPLSGTKPAADLDTGTKPHLILALDPNPKVVEYYQHQLRDHGYEVVQLTDPSRIIEEAHEKQPFAITLDVLWPEKDGWQILRNLKKDAATCNIPVIICTMLEDREKGLDMGADGYLTKPILGEDLVNVLQHLNGKN